jgi:HTH-type transcriptional regulator / antitoxin HipB
MMKEIDEMNITQYSDFTIDNRLNHLSEKPHNSKKIQKANEILARVGVPDLEKILKEEEAKKAKQQADLNQLGALIKQTRLQRHLSQEDLAALLGVENTVIFRLENNDTTVSMETILQVFHVLDAQLSFVVTLQQ